MDAAAYVAVHDRVAALVDDTNADLAVPACPGWRVRDLLGHLGGLCEDWVAGRLDGYASEAWTASQVARFSGRPISEVLRCWGTALASFVSLADYAAMGPPARWAFGDAVVHEADLRGALGTGRVPADVVWGSSGLTDIHRVGRDPREDVQNGDRGEEEAPAPQVVHPGVQG